MSINTILIWFFKTFGYTKEMYIILISTFSYFQRLIFSSVFQSFLNKPNKDLSMPLISQNWAASQQNQQMAYAPSKDSGHPQSPEFSLCTLKPKLLETDAQADLSLRCLVLSWGGSPSIVTLHWNNLEGPKKNFTCLCLACLKWYLGKQCRTRSEAAECGIWSRSTLFVDNEFLTKIK